MISHVTTALCMHMWPIMQAQTRETLKFRSQSGAGHFGSEVILLRRCSDMYVLCLSVLCEYVCNLPISLCLSVCLSACLSIYNEAGSLTTFIAGDVSLSDCAADFRECS